MNKRLRNILLGMVVLLWAGCIVVVITSFLKTPETYKDYPYAPTDIYSEGTVSVTEVIKGNLTAGQQIEAYKMGGYDGTEGVYYLLDSDVYPEVGQEYLFLANSDADGMFWLSAPKTVIPFASSDTMISTYSASEQSLGRQSVMDTYVDAYENEIPFSGKIYEDSVFPEAAVIED